jgi:hypothetical protein
MRGENRCNTNTNINTVNISKTASESEASSTTTFKDRTKDDILYDRKIDMTTVGLQQHHNKNLREISKENALAICDYLSVIKTEINPSKNYRKLLVSLPTFMLSNDLESFAIKRKGLLFIYFRSLIMVIF